MLEKLTVAELVEKFPDLTESEGVFAVTLKALGPSSGSRSKNQPSRRRYDQIQSPFVPFRPLFAIVCVCSS